MISVTLDRGFHSENVLLDLCQLKKVIFPGWSLAESGEAAPNFPVRRVS